jgi:anthranilate/para-aminobenzoate synthase component I
MPTRSSAGSTATSSGCSQQSHRFRNRCARRDPISASLDRERYLELVAEVKRRIFEGDVYQLQLGIRFGAALEGEAFDLYRALRRYNPSPYMFYVDTEFGQLLGASPEFLVRLEGRRARLRPLAGTRSRGRDDDDDARIARSCSPTKRSSPST